MNEKIPTPAYTIGMVVDLLSGGPRMTIETVSVTFGDYDTIAYRCAWFDLNHCLQREMFREETIKLA